MSEDVNPGPNPGTTSDQAGPATAVEPGMAVADEPVVPTPYSWHSRVWTGLHSRWARLLGIAAVGLGTFAAVGHFVGGLIGWWHAYEITFGSPHSPSSSESAKSKPAGKTPAVSMVVLPFANEGEPTDAWFTDALTGDLTTELGRITGSLVVARETANTYKGKVTDPRQVAREMGVRYVVSGTARRAGERVRLGLSIVDGETGNQRWAQNFDVDRTELSRSFDDIAQQIARALWMEIYRSAGERASKLKPHEVEADDLAMQAWGFWFRGITPENVAAALELSEQAVAKNPSSIRGWGGVSVMSGVGLTLGFTTDRAAARRRLQEASTRLQELDANDFFAINSKAQIANVDRDFQTMLLVADSLVERFPSEPSGYNSRASALLALGRFEDSIVAAERALRISKLDPRAGFWHFFIAANHFMLERYTDAADNARRAIVASPRLPLGEAVLAASLVRGGQKEEGRTVLQNHLSRNPEVDQAKLRSLMRSTEPRFVAGRGRMIESLREIGLP
ncbi:MAG: hypothetical protein V4684_02635 [Pseudomonadota bacterium]